MVLKPPTFEISIKDIETAHIIGTGTHRGITTSEIFCQQVTQCTAMTNFRLYLFSSTVPIINANMTTLLVSQHPIPHPVLTQKVDHPPTGYYVLLRCRKLFTRGMSLPTVLPAETCGSHHKLCGILNGSPQYCYLCYAHTSCSSGYW